MKSLVLILSFFVGLLISYVANAFELPVEYKIHQWKTGEVIGMSILAEDTTAMFYEAATASRYSHIGMVLVENGQVNVVEAIKPQARISTLEAFLSRAGTDAKSLSLQATVLDLRNDLTLGEQAKVIEVAHQLVDKPTLFNEKVVLDLVNMNAAELVYFIFKQVNRDVGTIDKVSDINHRAFAGVVWELFQQTGLAITLDSPVLTPMSIVISPALVPIIANLPTHEYLADQTLYAQWKAEGYVAKLGALIGSTEADLDELNAASSAEPYKVLVTNP